MKKLKALVAIIAGAIVVGVTGIVAAPANAATCNNGVLCGFDWTNYGGDIVGSGNGGFVEVLDDRTESVQNKAPRPYRAQNNTAWAQEETLAYINIGSWISSFGGNNNRIDHFRGL